jgi:hypothetical protein
MEHAVLLIGTGEIFSDFWLTGKPQWGERALGEPIRKCIPALLGFVLGQSYAALDRFLFFGHRQQRWIKLHESVFDGGVLVMAGPAAPAGVSRLGKHYAGDFDATLRLAVELAGSEGVTHGGTLLLVEYRRSC